MQPRLLYKYDRRTILLRLVAIQGMLLIVLFAMYKRPIRQEEGAIAPLVGVGLPFLAYLVACAMLLICYFRKDVIAIYDDGKIVMKWLREYVAYLPPDTIVEYSDTRLTLETSLDKVWYAKNQGGVVTLRIPGGVCPVGEGRFVIGDARGSGTG